MISPTFKDNFAIKAVTILKPDYFEDGSKQIVSIIRDYYSKHNTFPTLQSLAVDLSNMPITGNTYNAAVDKLQDIKDELTVKEVNDVNWLLKETENYCQGRAIHNAIMDSVEILNGTNKNKLPKTAIPQLLEDALSVQIDKAAGHDYLEDSMERYKLFNTAINRIPFKLNTLNKITGGGFARKTLNIFVAGPHVGKSLTMTSLAADYLVTGKNVLYISFEMAEEEIAKRVDANLMDVAMDDIKDLNAIAYDNKIKNIKAKTVGRLKIKEYPNGSAHIGHFKTLLKEYKMKEGFVPDVVFVDYLGICGCMKASLAQGSYVLLKAVSEELRAFAQECDLICISATQINRGGHNSSDADMTDIAESFGINYTADFILTMFADDNMKTLNQILFSQLKNRYKDMNFMNKFIMGVDRPKMRIYDLNNATAGIIQQSPAPHTSKPAPKQPFNKPNSFGSGPTTGLKGSGIKI